jgi:outer membrane protein
VGTRNIVDVLNAQNAVFSAQRDYANSRYDYVLNSMRLKENAGTLSPEDIAALEAFLVEPEAASASEDG